MTPGMPVSFTEVELASLIQYLEDELHEALMEHQTLEQDLKKWDDAYVGDPKQIKRHFPWPGAANIEIPVIGIAVEAIVARVMNTVHSMSPFWVIQALSKEVEPVCKPLEGYMEWSRKNEFDLYRQSRLNFNELIKYGWSWYKVGWEIFRRPKYVMGPNGVPVKDYDVVRRPCVYHILNRDVITQTGVEDYEQSEWICHRVRLTNNQLRSRVNDGLYTLDLEEAFNRKEDATDHHEAFSSNQMAGFGYKERFNTLYEFQLDWPYGPDMSPCPMVVVYHKELKKVVRAVHSPLGFRTLRKSDFIAREGRKQGMGIARRLWQMQEEISTIHRQQVDNSTLANTRFFVGRKNAIRANTQIWPGRVLLVPDPKNDFIPYQMGDIYQSQGVLESRALAYAERASGVSDYQLGRESSVAGSRATATSTMALISEGNRRFDLNIRDIREVLGQIGRDIIFMNQMFRPEGTAYFVQGADGQYTEEALRMPPEFSLARTAVELNATTATINREVEKQSLIALMGITTQYYEKLAQVAIAMSNPQIPGQVRELLVRETIGAKYLMERIVQTFDIKAVDTIVPGLVDPNAQPGPVDSGAAINPIGDQAIAGMGPVQGVPPSGPPNGNGGPGRFGQLQ